MEFGNLIEFNAFINHIVSEFKIKFYHKSKDFDENYYAINALFKALMLFEIRDYYNIEYDLEIKQTIIKEINNILDHGVTKNYYDVNTTYGLLNDLYSYRYPHFNTLTKLQNNIEFNKFKDEVPASFYILIHSLFLKSLYSLDQKLVNDHQCIFTKILSDFDNLIPSKIFVKINHEMNNPKVINNSLLNVILSFTAYEYSLASNESFYLGNRSTIADYSLSTLSSGDVVNPIFIKMLK